jgi:hypothetical protein
MLNGQPADRVRIAQIRQSAERNCYVLGIMDQHVAVFGLEGAGLKSIAAALP